MGLLYKSTRSSRTATASEAILKGLSEDGGLFVPERIPALDKTPRELGQMSYGEVAYEVMKLFLTDFTEEEHRKAWLLRVTANCCKKLRGSFWNKHTVSLSEAIPAQNEGEGELLELLDALPEKYRSVLHLYYYEGYATDEIAAILGRRAATVRSQLSRGRALLRDAWKGAEDV